MSTATSTAWRVRHEGSPRSVDNLSPQQILDGLQEGLWEPTDEVRGPDDAGWVPIESHPLFEEGAAEVEPPPTAGPDETHLDMNPLIDVCLVLLVFFILTTSYAALQKRFEAPDVTQKETPLPTPTSKEIKEKMIRTAVRMENGQPVVRVEGDVVPLDGLEAELSRRMGQAQKHILLLEHDDDVSHGTVVKVEDAAKGAGMQSVMLVVPQR